MSLIDTYDPYHLLGLKGNPFVTEQMVGVDPNLWVDRGFSDPPAISDRLFVQILGEKGAGKTSHLRHWQAQTLGTYAYFPDTWQRWYLPPVEPICYWDEANRIPLPLLAIALKQAHNFGSTVVAGTHADLSGIARSLGFRKIKTIHLETIRLEVFLSWVEKRIQAVQLDPDITIKLALDPKDGEKILAQSGASWRKAAIYLHIWAAEQAQNQMNLGSIFL